MCNKCEKKLTKAKFKCGHKEMVVISKDLSMERCKDCQVEHEKKANARDIPSDMALLEGILGQLKTKKCIDHIKAFLNKPKNKPKEKLFKKAPAKPKGSKRQNT